MASVVLLLTACSATDLQTDSSVDPPAERPGGVGPGPVAPQMLSAWELAMRHHDMNAALRSPLYAAAKVRPQAELEPGSRGVSSLPGGGSFVFPARLPLRERGASAFSEDQLVRDGDSYDPAQALQAVSTTEGEPRASFDSAADPQAPSLADCAYAVYSFNLLNAAIVDMPQSVGLQWREDNAPDNYFVALSNWDEQRWEWYQGSNDSVITLPTLYSRYRVEDGLLLVLVLVADSAPRELEFVQVGAQEVFGLGGMAPESLEAQLLAEPELHFAGKQASFVSDYTLPLAFDRLGYPYDQGKSLMCTCCAVAGAENYELSRNYFPLWYATQSSRRISPKWFYRKTLGGNCSLGRPPEQVLDLLKNTGGAVEAMAPFNLNCDDDWNGQVTEWDRAYLKIDGWKKIRSKGQSGIDEIKAYLSGYARPVIFLVTLDEGFKDGDFSGDAVWTWSDWLPNVINWHTMLIIGWDDARGAFLVRNSWGSDWGNGGDCWVSYSNFLSGPWVDCFVMWDDYSESVADWFGVNATVAARPPESIACSKGTFSSIINVTWSPVPGAAKYYVYRDDHNGYIAEVPGGTTEYDDSGVTDFDSHPYWVQTVVGNAEGPISTAVSSGWRKSPGPPRINQLRADKALSGLQVGSSVKLIPEYFLPTGGGAATLTWTFPNGATVEGPSLQGDHANVTFSAAGTHSCNLHIENSIGGADLPFNLVVYAQPQHPVASISGPANARKNRVVYFDASGSTCDSGQSISNCYWDFNGDGYYEEESSNPGIGHIFTFAGSYNVQVLVRDTRGLYSYWSAPLTVNVSNFDEVEDNDAAGSGLTMLKLKKYRGSIGPYAGCEDGDLTDWWVISYNAGFTHYVRAAYDSAKLGELTLKVWRDDELLYVEDISSDGLAEVYFPGTESSSYLYVSVEAGAAGGCDYELSFERLGEP
ncbi:PKD domain-containing protein [bacterium]|nr:PKD domain-containing protein [bacterium]